MSDNQPPNQPEQPGSMPSYPSAPQGEGAPAAARAEQPPSVRLAVRLMYVGAVLSALSIIVSLVTTGSQKDRVREQLEKNNSSVSADQVNSAFAVGIVIAIVIGLIAVGLWIWMAVKNGQGRNWARITATVLGALNVVFTVLGLVGSAVSTGSGGLDSVLSIIGALLAIVILVLLYRGDSNDFFRAQSGRPA